MKIYDGQYIKSILSKYPSIGLILDYFYRFGISRSYGGRLLIKIYSDKIDKIKKPNLIMSLLPMGVVKDD